MTRKTFAQRADDSVRWTGIPALLARSSPRRSYRWLPLLLLLLAITGMVIAIVDPGHAYRAMLVLVVAISGATIVRQRGPLYAPFGPDRPDERERAQFNRAYAAAGFLTWTVMPLGLIALAGYARYAEWSVEELANAAIAAALFQMTWWATLPTLYASWTTTPLDEH